MRQGPKPFQSTGPIRDAERFFNRERELRIILDALQQGQSVQVVGPRRRGKTSLLFALRRELGAEKAWYFTLENFRRQEDFWRKLAERAGVPWNEDEADLLALGEVLGEKRVILLLDEMDRAIAAAEAFDDDFFVTLRGWEIGQNVRFVVAAKAPLTGYARLQQGPTSPFGNTFLLVSLEPFDLETTRALLQPLQDKARSHAWPKDWVERVHRGGHGEPWKLQRFGELAWDAEDPAWETLWNQWQQDIQAQESLKAEPVGPRAAVRPATQEAPSVLPALTFGLLFVGLLFLGIALVTNNLVTGSVAAVTLLLALVLLYKLSSS